MSRRASSAARRNKQMFWVRGFAPPRENRTLLNLTPSSEGAKNDQLGATGLRPRLYHSKNPAYRAAYTTPTTITSSPKNLVVQAPMETYFSPILPPTVREKVAMGM